VLLAGLAFLLATQLFLAQLLAQRGKTPPPPAGKQASDLSFRTTVNRVIVDVVVTDKNGKRVRGLTRKDFSVTEDNVPQRMVAFDVHDFDTLSESLPPNLPPLPVNTFLNVPKVAERGPLYVLLLDLVNTETKDQMWSRGQLLKFIDSKPEGTRFAVFLLAGGLRLVQGFTSDRNLLYAAVDPKHHVPRVFLYSGNYGKGNRGLMVSVFNDIAQYLEGLPGRKNLMWMADSFPISVTPVEGDPYQLADDTRHAIDAMARSQVAVYTFAACGISADDPSCGGDGSGGGLAGSLPMYDAAIAVDVAAQTGGKSYATNDFQGELSDATEDGANYYAITYASSNQSYDGKKRKIKVKLAEGSYELSYRRSYYADDPNAPVVQRVSSKYEEPPPPPRKPGDSLVANMEYGAPMAHQLIFRAHLQALGAPAMGTPAQMANLADQPAYFQLRRKDQPEKPLKPIELQTYAVDYIVMPAPKAEGNERPLALEFATAAYDTDGVMLNGVVENGTLDTSSDAKLSRVQSGASASPDKKKQFFRAQLQIDVPLAATSIRVAVRDMNTDRVGAMEVTLPLAAEGPAEATVPASTPPADPAPGKPN
jgi:VWFA-related protein